MLWLHLEYIYIMVHLEYIDVMVTFRIH